MSTASLAPPLLGSYFNSLLYSLVLVGVYVYFFRHTRSKADSILVKGAVLVSLVSDTLGTIASIAMIYVFTIVFPVMNPPSINRLFWCSELWIATNMISATVFQCFMVARYFRVSGNWILSIIICLLIATSFSSSVYLLSIYESVTESAALFSTESSTYFSARFIALAMASSMATDVLISGALIWQLQTTEAISPHTKSLVQRVSTQTIKTGAIPCLFAMVVLITHLAHSDGSISVCFAFMLGRVYTLTMLFTLISRDNLAPSSKDVESQGRSRNTTETYGLGRSVGDAGNGGVTITKTTVSSEVGHIQKGKTSNSLPSTVDGPLKEGEKVGGSPARDSIMSSASPGEGEMTQDPPPLEKEAAKTKEE